MRYYKMSTPAPFEYVPCEKKVLPDPRTVRSSDLTWFNTCGNNIVRSDYNTKIIEKQKFISIW